MRKTTETGNPTEDDMASGTAFQTAVIGGGMIVQTQILPALYQLQRLGLVGDITVCARHGRTLQRLVADETLKAAFPGHGFTPMPGLDGVADPDRPVADVHRQVLAALPPRNLVVMALPDHLHFEVVMAALEADQHVLAVKPLVLSHADAVRIETTARARGLFVGVEYHKRFDDRALMARQHYRKGELGEFRLGQALLIEPWYYRDSNFQNWCTCENSDMFTYVGCHYVDQVHFITGLLPVEVSVYGIVDRYPNGNEGYLWTDARVLWDNGASLNVINAIGYPNAAAGGNMQGLRMFCKGAEDACLLFHDDQFRGVKYSFERQTLEPGAPAYREPSPDYFKLLYRGGDGLEPVGYGYRSVEALVRAARRVEAAGASPAARRAVLEVIDREGIIATPRNSAFNELVIEAGRLSIGNGGRPVAISYGATPRVQFRDWSS